MQRILTIAMAVLLGLLPPVMANARDRIQVVGSAAVLPFVQMVAENFAIHFDHPSPSMDVTGSGRGFQLLCTGIGYQHPDINVTARPMSDAELAKCRQNGVDAVVEIVVGLDALTLVNDVSAAQHNFTTAQLFTALSANVPQAEGLGPNPYRKWSEIDARLPDSPIRVMGPSPTTSHYYAFSELVLGRGCDQFPELSRLSGSERALTCQRPRRDGLFIPGLNNASAILDWLRKNPDAFAIVSLALLELYPDYLRANRIDGFAPETTPIASGAYPLSRPIYLYVKQRHVAAVSGLQEFLYEFSAERTIGPDGYLTGNGFNSLSNRGRNTARDLALSLAPLAR